MAAKKKATKRKTSKKATKRSAKKAVKKSAKRSSRATKTRSRKTTKSARNSKKKASRSKRSTKATSKAPRKTASKRAPKRKTTKSSTKRKSRKKPVRRLSAAEKEEIERIVTEKIELKKYQTVRRHARVTVMNTHFDRFGLRVWAGFGGIIAFIIGIVLLLSYEVLWGALLVIVGIIIAFLAERI